MERSMATITQEETKFGGQRSYYRAFEIGLSEIDRLIQEAKRVLNPLVSSKSIGITSKIIVDEDAEDHISGLPNDILQFIISLLTMREGAATCILSTRWRHLWSTSVSRLDFDDLNLLGYKYPPANISGDKQIFQQTETTKFRSRADHICQFRRGDLKMDTLQVSFLLYQDSAVHIDRWVELAAAQGVNKLALNLSIPFSARLSYRSGIKYMFPVERFGSSLNSLELKSCTFKFPPNFHGLDSLTFLSLSNCVLTGNDVQNAVSNCPIQCLSLKCCEFPDSTVLNFNGPTVQLKHLHIMGNFHHNAKEINLHDINLLSFEAVGCNPKLSIKDVPSLTRLVLHDYGPVEITDNLPGLETLFHSHDETELQLSAFSNLKQLVFAVDEMRSNLFEVVSFLDACPLLQKLELDIFMQFYEELEELEGLSSKIGSRHGCSHHNLKEVHIYGFDSHPEIIELAIYLLENATVLEKMVMYAKCKSYYGDGMYLISREPAKLLGMSLEDAHNMLMEKARPTTNILLA